MGAAVAAGIMVCVGIVTIFLIILQIDSQEAKQDRWEGACAQEQGKPYYIDQDHKVCIRNGEVVEIRG